MRLSSNMIDNSGDGTNFPHTLLLTNIQVANLCKIFANSSSTDISYQNLSYLKSRKISWQTFWSINKDRIAINEKCN